MNLNKQYIDHGAKWGIIQFVVGAAVFYAMYFINLRFAVTSGIWVTIPISIALLAVQGLQARKFNAGALTYGDAFKTMFIAVAISSTLFLASNFVVKSYIAPDKAEEEKIIQIEETAKRMENWGVDDDTIDETIEKMELRDAKPKLFETLIGLIVAIIVNTLIVLIVAIFVKRKPKEGEIIIEQ